MIILDWQYNEYDLMNCWTCMKIIRVHKKWNESAYIYTLGNKLMSFYAVLVLHEK